MPDSDLVELGSIIYAAAKQLNPFYNEDTFEFDFPDHQPTNVQSQSIGKALEATLKLQQMLLGPLGSIMLWGAHECDLATLHTIHNFSIAQHVPEHGTATFSEISQRCGISVSNLRRILRHAMTNRIFAEPSPGIVAHTPISRHLSHDPLTRSTVSMLVDEQFPASANLSRAMRECGHSTDATSTAWALANDAKRPMIEELQSSHPDRANHFAAFMKHNWSTQNPFQPLVDNYDWASLGSAHVVDVGGGMGHASIALAQAFPNLSFTVQDFGTVAKAGEKEVPDELRGRITFMEHDFFKEQPVKGAHVYLLRSVLHDWPDEECAKVLQALVPALEEGTRVLVNDFVMPMPGELGFMEDRRARTLDLVMMMLFNAREREYNEWKPLFEKADQRFKFQGARPSLVNKTNIPTKKLLSIIEATWVP